MTANERAIMRTLRFEESRIVTPEQMVQAKQSAQREMATMTDSSIPMLLYYTLKGWRPAIARPSVRESVYSRSSPKPMPRARVETLTPVGAIWR